MFTGIITEIGIIEHVTQNADALRIRIHAPGAVEGAQIGGSISVSGVCLTVVELDGPCFTADVMAQTLKMSTLGHASSGTAVNIEAALQVGDRLGGHIVQGHIDGTATLKRITAGEAWRVLRFSLTEALAPLMVDKGSIAVDGVSLTVSAVSDSASNGWFEVSLIPKTLTTTTLGERTIGDAVNLETDILARHVERMLRLNSHANLPSSLVPPPPGDTQ